MTKTGLKKSLTLTTLTLYGLGTTIGAGIYALVGEMAASAGPYMPISFLLAAVLAGLTGLSFAELSSRYPLAGGAAVYVKMGFGSQTFSLIVGLAVALAGMVSAAGIINGFVGYLQTFFDVSRELSIVGIVLVMGGLAVWGIKETVGVAVTITLIEIGGLLLVIAVGLPDIFSSTDLSANLTSVSLDAVALSGVVSGTFLAFYAFIGFEDMVNVAEETKSATQTVPRAILLTLGITALVYLLISLIAVLTMPMDELAGHPAPLKFIFAEKTGGSGDVIGYIAIVAMINGAVVQLVMASRILYGLSNQGALPAVLGRVHPGRGTPVIATVLVTGTILALALWFRLAGLAAATSFITLIVFAVVNLALLIIKRRQDADQHTGTTIPAWVPIAGFASSAGFLALEVFNY